MPSEFGARGTGAALAKAEVKDSATKAGKGAGMLAGAGYAGHFVVLFLSLALWMGLADLIDNLGRAAVIVAVLCGVVAAVLALMGRKQLKTRRGHSADHGDRQAGA